MKRGKFIAMYGVNGIGKTTQSEALVGFLSARGKNASRLKYPVYDLPPEGPFIYRYLRDPEFRTENALSTAVLQEKYAENRRRYEPTLRERLESGEWIVAEDYSGTGIAWGLAWGGSLSSLEAMNADLLKPDLEILLSGERFLTAIEEGHRNESDRERMTICGNFHELLGERYGWVRVDANRDIDAVSNDIDAVVVAHFGTETKKMSLVTT
jgi:thymidylate kinase